VGAKLDQRTQGRKPVNYLATLTHGRAILSCRIVELSDAGARVELVRESAVVEGSIRLTCPQIGEVGGAVVWQKATVVGLKFDATPKGAKLHHRLGRDSP
jgi:hypothetical protein